MIKKKFFSDYIMNASEYLEYNNLIRSLHANKLKKENKDNFFLTYFYKLFFILIGTFFTTSTFYFLIDSNGIYNSGLNGFIQSISKLIIGYKKISWDKYYLLYYTMCLITNIIFILFLKLFFNAELNIISTSIFYSLFQIFWTKFFVFFNLKDHIFDKLNPSSWNHITKDKQLSFTLPYYIVISLVSSIIHTFGYSLIFKSKSTPGGLEIFTSYFSSQKDNKISISLFTKIFGFFIIFLVSLINFFFINDNKIMKKSFFEKEIYEIRKNLKEEIRKDWEKEIEEIMNISFNFKDFDCKKKTEKHLKKVEKKISEIFEIDIIELEKILGIEEISKYPQDIILYIENKKNKLKIIKKEIEKNIFYTKERKKYLEKEKKSIEKEISKNNFFRYLSYITNNEKLWATVIYVFFSSFIISQVFPKDKLVLVKIYCSDEEKKDNCLILLDDFDPFYYNEYKIINNKEKKFFIINCYLSKWNYYLNSPALKKIGKNYVSENSK